MASENLQRMREAFSAFNRGDYEAVVAVMHPDVEWVPYLGALQSSGSLRAPTRGRRPEISRVPLSLVGAGRAIDG